MIAVAYFIGFSDYTFRTVMLQPLCYMLLCSCLFTYISASQPIAHLSQNKILKIRSYTSISPKCYFSRFYADNLCDGRSIEDRDCISGYARSYNFTWLSRVEVPVVSISNYSIGMAAIQFKCWLLAY